MSTTLEILAPYLPYGIEVENIAWGTRRVLTGLRSKTTVEVQGAANIHIADCLPVLRSFADLCTPLEDGTVPAACELVKALTYYPSPELDSEAAQPVWETASAIDVNGDTWIQWLSQEPGEGGEEYEECFILNADWSGYWLTEDGREPAGWLLIDWLRRHHFAVGLTADQYIRKQS